MVSPGRSETARLSSTTEVVMAEPRISFSAEYLDDDSFISISPNSSLEKEQEIDAQIELELAAAAAATAKNNPSDFEFLSSKNSFDGTQTMLTADELFFEGKLLPFCQIHHAAEKLSKISIKSDDAVAPSAAGKPKDEHSSRNINASAILLGREPQEPRIWFVDDDPSPRPPKCTVLWKELLRLRKNPRNSTLSPSSSSSSSSSSASSLGEAAAMEEREKEHLSSREKHIKRVKKGLERTRSATIRIRPMVNVPLCNTQKSSSLPPLFPLRKPRIDR